MGNVNMVCKRYGERLKTETRPNFSFMFDQKTNLMFCRNAKVGTTTWLTHFLLLHPIARKKYDATKISSGKLHNKIPFFFTVPAKNPKELRKLAESSISFSMVRHPFERLVSAYQDKVIDRPVGSIIKSLKNNYGQTTFESFAYLVIKSASKNECLKTYGNCKFNNHWKPYISRCGYCEIPYKIIAKAETFAEDQKYIGRLANVNFTTLEKHVSSGGSTKSLSEKYFSQLDLETVVKLYQVYKVDFQMFGYSPDKYYEFARSHRNKPLNKQNIFQHSQK